MFDVAIIGGGVIGSLLACALSKYTLRVCLIEKEADLACGASGANSSIVHSGYDPIPGTKKALYNRLGKERMPLWCRDLGVPYRQNGAILLSFHSKDEATLRDLVSRGATNGVSGLVWLDKHLVLSKEPAVSPDITGGLYVPDSGIVCPYELTFAGAEIASQNGVAFFFEYQVIKIEKEGSPDSDGGFVVSCRSAYQSYPAVLRSRVIVNAAGVFSAAVSAMVNDDDFSIIPRRGEYIVLDKSLKGTIQHTIFQTPGEQGKGVLITPTVDGNILVGPNSSVVEDADSSRTSRTGLDEVMRLGLKSVPQLDMKKAIRNFAGIRATSSTGDFIIGASGTVRGFFRAAGIESPGLTAAPAIAEELSRQIADYFGSRISEKLDYIKTRAAPIRFRELCSAEQEKLIRKDKRYATVICRCEHVTEAEIREAIRRGVGVATVNGIKMRTRAGMGRCQGGFCMPRILPILADERGVPIETITMSGAGSEIIRGKKR